MDDETEHKECIFCFLTDKNQRELQKQVQLQEEKFEDILKMYKKIFINNFLNAINNPICSKHGKIHNAKDILRMFEENKDEILKILEAFFKILIEIYTDWISGKPYIAVEKLLRYNEVDDKLKEYSLKK